MSSKLDKALAKLKPHERAFVAAYTDRDNPKTYGKALPSAMVAKPSLKPSSAPVTGHRLSKSVNVQLAVGAIMEQQGFGSRDRAVKLRDLADTETQEIKHYDADGNLTHRVETPVPVAARLKAIDIANKLDGSYAKAEAAVDIAKREYEQTLKALERKLF